MGWDERVELGDTGNRLENGVIKDKDGNPLKRTICPKCFRSKIAHLQICSNCGHQEEDDV
jgi:hypothetical protein